MAAGLSWGVVALAAMLFFGSPGSLEFNPPHIVRDAQAIARVIELLAFLFRDARPAALAEPRSPHILEGWWIVARQVTGQVAFARTALSRGDAKLATIQANEFGLAGSPVWIVPFVT